MVFSSSPIQGTCFQLENQLFDVESRLKKIFDNKEHINNSEYDDLVQRGQEIRQQWKIQFEKIRHKKLPAGFNIQKCKISKTKKINL